MIDADGKLIVKKKGGDATCSSLMSASTHLTQKPESTSNAAPTVQPAGAADRKPRKAKEAEPRLDAPHSEMAEWGILGSMLLDPSCIAEVLRDVNPFFFYIPSSKVIFETLSNQYRSGQPTDLITLTQVLRDRKLLDSVGGAAHITHLFTFVPTAANVRYYVDIVREKFLLREMIATGTHLVRAAHGKGEIDIPDLLASFGDKLDRIKHTFGGANGSELFGISDLLAFNPKSDPDCLIGNRYIVKGGSSLWAGGSGYGKSSLILQLAVYWACGVACFGLKPVRPLRSLIIQAENNAGDMGEQLQGVFAGIQKIGDIDVADCRELIERNVIIRRTLKTGLHFLSLLDELCEFDKPDLAWPDPLFAFAGCDLMNQKETTRFLRDGLFPIADKHKVAMNVVHHVGKPVRGDAKDKSDMADVDYQYLGFGSSEIQNSFRAVNTLVPVGKTGIFKLVLSKRGERAGALDSEGKWTRTLHLTHSTEGICWLQTEAPEKPTSVGKLKYTDAHILEEMSVGAGETVVAMQERLKGAIGMSAATFYRLWDSLKRNGKVKPDGSGGWIKKQKTELPN